MDLSGLIFVAIFVGWALYLIPKFMRDHEELATTRSLQEFSARLRVFAATRASSKLRLLGPDEPTVEISMDEIAAALGGKGRLNTTRPAPLPTLRAARRAAQRRRRVLTGLLLVTAVVSVLAAVSIVPVWAPALPGVLLVAFAVSARRSVRRLMALRHAHATYIPPVETDIAVEPAPTITEPEDVAEPVVVPVAAQASAADGLWDPVPMTLPTYVGKPSAQRTVMSIELNQGIVSSGHDAADSELARAAEALADDTPVDLEAPRRAAGA